MSERRYVLAVDFGSTWCKAAYINPAGEIVALARSYVRGAPDFGHDHQDLRRAWDGFAGSVRDVTERLNEIDPDARPDAIAISVRKAPGIWLDAEGCPIEIPRSAVDNAGRSNIVACYASEVWGEDDPFAYGYSLDLLGNTRWLRREFPDGWGRIRYAGTLHNWFIRQLTGRWVTSHAAGPVQDTWPGAAAELTGLPLSAFPQVVEDTSEVGKLLAHVAKELGLPFDTAVVAGTHDGAAANIGAGAIQPGDACITLGTNGVLRVVTGDRLPGRFGYTVTADRWALVRDAVGMALRLEEVVRAMNSRNVQVDADHHEQLEAEAFSSATNPELLVEILGIDTEHLSNLTSQWTEIGKSRGLIYRTALEDAAFRLLSLAQIATESGVSIDRFLITGGATDNQLLLKMIASGLDSELLISTPEAGLIGAGILSAVGTGWFKSVDDAVGAMVHHRLAIDPDPALAEVYASLMTTLELPTGFAPGDTYSY